MPARALTAPPQPPGIDELLLPGVPANVRPGGRFKVGSVTSDMYNISGRLAEINPRLAINITEDQANGNKAYTIVEETETGPQVVFRCTVLDARVLGHVRYLIKVPFEKRYELAEKRAEKYEADCAEAESQGLADKMAGPMRRELERCGFITQRGGFVNFPSRFGAS